MGARNTLKCVIKKEKKHQNVKVIDFDMEFGSMVMFMVKWVIASIPAMMILGLLWLLVNLLFFGGLSFLD